MPLFRLLLAISFYAEQGAYNSAQHVAYPAANSTCGGSSDLNVQAVRAFSRLNVLFITFINAHAAGNEIYTQPHVAFPSPSLTSNTEVGADSFLEHTLRWQVQIGSSLYPEAPASSIPEAFAILREAVGVYDESIRTLNITPQSFKDGKYIIAVPLQTVPGQFASGLNTRSGDLLSFRASNVSPTVGGGVGKVVLTFVNESILEIREGGVDLLD